MRAALLKPLCSRKRRANKDGAFGAREDGASGKLFVLQFGELGKQGAESASTMTEGVFFFERNFGHGAVECGEKEERIVAEAAVAARHGEDFSVDAAFGGEERAPGLG